MWQQYSILKAFIHWTCTWQLHETILQCRTLSCKSVWISVRQSIRRMLCAPLSLCSTVSVVNCCMCHPRQRKRLRWIYHHGWIMSAGYTLESNSTKRQEARVLKESPCVSKNPILISGGVGCWVGSPGWLTCLLLPRGCHRVPQHRTTYRDHSLAASPWSGCCGGHWPRLVDPSSGMMLTCIIWYDGYIVKSLGVTVNYGW